ncbi:GAF domain-containing protein [Halobacteriovorax sp. HLS]|uniref:GAF domain-containing protein n=1 Tax=Halobacteriovorax sp. HLS TaxID=2234000 RepID=UPI000FD841A5|nr:GAF domain-containing protein [Halobacteriovorax sp. HLS]
MNNLNILKEIFLTPIENTYFWAGIYRRKKDRASRLCFVGPMPPCHEFEFGKGNVGLTADIGIRKVIADVSTDEQYSQCFIQTASEVVEPIFYEDELVGVIDLESDEKNFFNEKRLSDISELSKQIAPVLRSAHIDEELEYNLKVLEWVSGAKKLIPQIADWIGVYFKTGYLAGIESENLILGPFLGESTDHTLIPIEKGLCGLALREQRVVNVDDVHADSRHIACSLKTNSELIIPLTDRSGNYIAELDIDSNRKAAFSEEIELKMKEYCKTFPLK